MNNLLRLFIVFNIWGLGLNQASASDEIVHSVIFPSGDAAWSITFQAPTSPGRAASPTPPASPSASPPARKVKKIDIVRNGELRRDTVVWSDGSATEYWWSKKSGLVLLQDETTGRVRAAKTGTMGGQLFDASTFAWVGEATFKGMRPFEKKQCRYYEIEIPIIDGEKEILHAWIDDESQKPSGWSRGGGDTVLFSFDLPLPSEPLVMPEKYQKEMARIGAFFAPSPKSGLR